MALKEFSGQSKEAAGEQLVCDGNVAVVVVEVVVWVGAQA